MQITDGNGQILGDDPLRPLYMNAGPAGASTPSATGTVTSVPSSITSGTVAAANAARKRLTIANNSATGTLFLRFATGSVNATTTFSMALGPIVSGTPQSVTVDNYTGVVAGIWSAADGTAQVTVFT